MISSHPTSSSPASRLAIAVFATLPVGVLFAPSPAIADVTPADLAGQPAIMKQACRNRLGMAGNSLCNTDAAYAACIAYLKAGRWDQCLRAGEAGSQARRSTPAEARTRLVTARCTELAAGQYRCPDIDFNRSSAYNDCIGYRNGGSVASCLRRDFLREYADRIDARLRLNAPVGYAYVITNGAGDRIERASGAARRAPDPNPLAMAATSPYPTASVSKNITAAATLRALGDRGLSVDTPVWPYLPTDWSYSAAFRTITFRGLLRHRSGLYNAQGVRCDEAQKAVDYAAMKGCVASVQSTQYADSDCDKKPIQNAAAIGCYQNLDYAMLRVAIAKLDTTLGAASTEATIDKFNAGPLQQQMAALRDRQKAELFANLYRTYVNARVFVPAGFTAECKPTLGIYQPQVYNLKTATGGTDFGDRSLLCGSEGWVLSAELIAQYLHQLDSGAIIPRAAVDQMKEALLGWEASGDWNTPFGVSRRWWHGGCYNSGALCNLSTLAMSYSNGVQLAIVFNSDFPNGRTYGDDVTNAFYDTLR